MTAEELPISDHHAALKAAVLPLFVRARPCVRAFRIGRGSGALFSCGRAARETLSGAPDTSPVAESKGRYGYRGTK